ncbi:MAG: S-adenosylmethionine:tRNA ribosyltransferase-isomerase, partial [Crocinitomicaceae bacterium]|nr:S-adenosylmethionine:tRNA ribosyltransferase-isomerase [Crocinitomicaceae bacterium]
QTKVVNARLLFKKETGGVIEIFCLEPCNNIDPQVALQQKNTVKWNCMIGGAKKWKDGPLSMTLDGIEVKATKIGRSKDDFAICFEWPGSLSFSEILEKSGELPLPPYMNRKAEKEDLTRYQTVYAQHEGSVAAPTAGLHFTEELTDSFASKGVSSVFLTLHVGAGTFKPVKTNSISEHAMHAELIDVSIDAVFGIIEALGPIIPVGTTSLRTLESLYWFGVLASLGELNGDVPELGQWSHASLPELNLRQSIRSLLDYLDAHGKTRFVAKTSLMITPGYKFKVARGLITNFHMPKSTLLLIISAMIGDNWKTLYKHALKNDFRFLSYGDCCLLLP